MPHRTTPDPGGVVRACEEVARVHPDHRVCRRPPDRLQGRGVGRADLHVGRGEAGGAGGAGRGPLAARRADRAGAGGLRRRGRAARAARRRGVARGGDADDAGQARRDLALGRALEQHADVADGADAGELRTEQARVIVEAVDALPPHVDAETRELAEATLLELAARHDARDLRADRQADPRRGRPRGGGVPRGGRAGRGGGAGAAGVELTLIDDGEGRCHGRFTVPSHVGAMLKRHLLALANPARHAEAELRDEAGDWKPLRRRLGEAFVEYVERYPVDATPQTAGVNATVVVTMTLEQLLAEHATALLDDGSRMTAGQARRLACEAGIIPAVLGTNPSRSTWAAPPGSSTRPNASPSACATAAAPRGAARRRVRLPRPPRRPVVAPRPHRPRQRPAAVSPPPPAGPRLPLRDDRPRRQQGHLRQADVGRRGAEWHTAPR